MCNLTLETAEIKKQMRKKGECVKEEKYSFQGTPSWDRSL